MHEGGILFDIFYYLGYVAIAAATVAGIYIFKSWLRDRGSQG